MKNEFQCNSNHLNKIKKNEIENLIKKINMMKKALKSMKLELTASEQM